MCLIVHQPSSALLTAWCLLPFAFLLRRQGAIVEAEVVVCIRLGAQNDHLSAVFFCFSHLSPHGQQIFTFLHQFYLI